MVEQRTGVVREQGMTFSRAQQARKAQNRLLIILGGAEVYVTTASFFFPIGWLGGAEAGTVRGSL